METRKLISILTLPARVYGTSMRPSVLLMCKIFVLLLIAHGYYGSITDPYIPFIREMDVLNNYPGIFEYTVKAMFIIAGTSLILNYKVRTSAIIIAITIFLALMASKPIFRNHLFVIGCVLLLSALSDKNKAPWLIYYQLALVYFGALLNKLMQIEWWTGQFMHNWLSVALENPIYNLWYESAQSYALAKFMSYSAMGAELIIGFCLLFPKARFYGITMILFFHTILFSFTGETFGYFMEDIVIIIIAFRAWPKNITKVYHGSSKLMLGFIGFLKILDFDKRFSYENKNVSDSTVKADIDGNILKGRNAIISILLSTSGFYFLLLFTEMAIRLFFGGFEKYLCLLILFWSLIILMSPIFFERFKRKRFRLSGSTS